ncbi:hypothetical protein F0P96_03600 [Hymenobacter busanensis]|uniref:Uncharacterized protein n=1 Tax=Hymenobacter busanensis TaxID=2607656 RepID=A0A7L4ZUC9_9BACT|nr:hypothetical protein [Hymenobacter busanensis]KAA9339712.1 hypothetical protein F0P96_03600 [Hymenobacter busanensis]QHJ06533.1 hypothetical protein GUY19_04150 [Hymenobacter busanensis]
MKTPRRRFLVVFLLVAVGGRWPAMAQRALVQEFSGSTVLLASGDTLNGPLTFHADRDVVLVTLPDQTVRTVSAVAVKLFAVKGEKTQRDNDYYDYYNFYDSRRGYYNGNPYWNGPRPTQRRDTALVRVFRTYRWDKGNDYSDFKTPAFFEQLSTGPVILLRREALVERMVNSSPYYAGYGYGLPRGPVGYYTDIRDYFFLGTPQGNVVELRNPKKDLLAYFSKEARQLEQYAKTNKLSFTDAHELAYLVNYANSLRKQPEQ